MTKPLRIDEMYAYVAVEKSTGDEGITAFFDPEGGTWLPMVGADMERVEALRPIAQMLAEQGQQEIRVLRFSVREEIEVIKSDAQ